MVKTIRYFRPVSFLTQFRDGEKIPVNFGPLLSATPIINEAKRLGFEIQEGDAFYWTVKKTKQGLLIQAKVQK